MGKKRFAPVTIGVPLDWRCLRHAIVEDEPLPNHKEFRRQASALAAQGLSVAAIATALGVRAEAVSALLRQPVPATRGDPRNREAAEELAAIGLPSGSIGKVLGLRRRSVRELLGEPVED